MTAFVEIFNGETATRIPLGSVETIGRDRSNTIQLHDELVSRNHALIRKVGNEQFYVLDAGSRNGCYLNDQRVTVPTLLKNNDSVSMGNTKLVFIQELEEDEQPPDLEDIEEMGETISFVRSDIRSVTILVADIRGFTSLSENVEITILSKLMSKWFYEVQNIIEAHQGKVDKFIGDCVMALWDTQNNNPREMVMNCLRAANEINTLTHELSDEDDNIPHPLRIGAGINTGIAALGVGNENTAMGDTVNLAFRLESATKTLNSDLLLSHSSYSILSKDLWESNEKSIKVKGKENDISICALTFNDLKFFLERQQ